MTYAIDTSVPIERSKQQIEMLLRRYGADEFQSGWSIERRLAWVHFRMKAIYVKLTVTLPSKSDYHVTPGGKIRTEKQLDSAWEQGCRARWRALFLLVQAKLVAVEAWATSLEKEFLADVVMADGTTASEWIVPQLTEMYRSGRMPALAATSTVER